jgi:uncharacterized phiE125 gp8 family phage protein
MWYPTTISAPGTEPVTSAQAKEQCGVTSSETAFDTKLTRLITVARAHVEAYCGARFGSRSATMLCDSFADLARLPEAPVSAVTSITYVDTAGVTQTLSTDVYELRGEGLEAAIVLKYEQSWPSFRPGSRITVTATVGYSTQPEDVVHAMLLHIADMFGERESVQAATFSTMDALLCNHRRGA